MFVVFEGIDGSGKTTLSNQVCAKLEAEGLRVKHLRAAGNFTSKVVSAIRELGRDARHLALVPKAEFLLYVSREVQLMEETLRPALGAYDVIIADRFLFTAEVLGGAGRHLEETWMRPILEAAAGELWPELVVLVDVDPTLAKARRKSQKLLMGDKKPPSRKGLNGSGLQMRLREGYLHLAQRDPARWVTVDNDAALEMNVAKVSALISQAYRQGVTPALADWRSASGVVAPPADSPARALPAFQEWLAARMEREPHAVAYLLRGLAGPGVDAYREALAARVPEALLLALTGLQDEVSWQLRERLAQAHPRAALASLGDNAGDPRSWALRRQLGGMAPAALAVSLTGLHDPQALSLRERLFLTHPQSTVQSLAGVDGPEAWALRERWLAADHPSLREHYETAWTAMRAIHGLGGARAWEWRTLAHGCAPVAMLLSMQGLSDEASFSWRLEYLNVASKAVMESLVGVRHDMAWRLRSAVATDCPESLDGLEGWDDAEAWRLRDALVDRWPATVVKSVGALAHTERGRALIERQRAAYPRHLAVLKQLTALELGAGEEDPCTRALSG